MKKMKPVVSKGKPSPMKGYAKGGMVKVKGKNC